MFVLLTGSGSSLHLKKMPSVWTAASTVTYKNNVIRGTIPKEWCYIYIANEEYSIKNDKCCHYRKPKPSPYLKQCSRDFNKLT